MIRRSRFLLDTNILSDLIHYPHGRVAQRIMQFGAESVCTCMIVVCEIRYGLLKKGSSRLIRQAERILDEIEILPLEQPMENAYAEIRTTLERAGTPIGANDLLIAAQAKTLGLTLVTDNIGEFSRVEGLSVVNWR